MAVGGGGGGVSAFGGAAGFGVGPKLLDGADPRSATAIAARLRAAREAAGHPA